MTALQFCNAFAKQWKIDTVNRAGDIIEAFINDNAWTNYMMTMENSFLSKVAEGMNFAFTKEWGKIDVVYYNEGDQDYILFPLGERYRTAYT